MNYLQSSLLLLAAVATTTISFTEAVFEEVETDFGGVTPTGVVFPSICIGRVDVPKVMYTIEPSDDVVVLTDPPNLVEVGIDPTDGLLYFKFVQDTLDSNPFDAGVIVQFPAADLQTINVCCGQELQVQDGFTNVETLVVSAGATAQVVFGTNNVNLEVTVREEATATVEVNAARDSEIVVNGSGSGTFVDIAGDITSIVCTDRATCSVAGQITDTGASSVEGFSILDTEDCADISVDGGSTCDESFPFVSANVDGSLTISGVTERCIQGGELDGNFADGDENTPTVSPAPTEVQEPTESPAPTVERPTPSPIDRPTTPDPTPFPTTSSGGSADQHSPRISMVVATAAVLAMTAPMVAVWL
jgi:hypothetical protein